MQIRLAIIGAGVSVVLGCQGSDRIEIVPVEANNLGISQVEIEHTTQSGDSLLVVRGVDADHHELARATLRTGIVFYTSDPSMPAEGNMGTELNLSLGVGHPTYTTTVPDLEPHTQMPPNNMAEFVGLKAVATAIEDQAGIRFLTPPSTTEKAFVGAASCTASTFPTTGPATECCQQTGGGVCAGGTNNGQICVDNSVCTGGGTCFTAMYQYHKTSSNLLVNRLHGTACTTSAGSSSCSGMACYFGPCSMAINFSIGGVSGGGVFRPADDTTVCGYDDGDGFNYPEPLGSNTLWGAPTPSCSCTGCTNGVPTPSGCTHD